MRRPAIAPLLFGSLLAAMAVGQTASLGAFERALGGYGVFGGAEAIVAFAVIGAELAAASALLASRSLPRRVAGAGALLGLAVAAFWSVLALQAFARGLALDNCGCFGAYLAQPLRWWVLLEDAYMLVLAWYAAASAGLPLSAPGIRLRRAQEAT